MENKQQTALDFYIDKINEWFEDACVHCELCKEDNEIYQQAKQMEKEQMIEFAEFVASHPDKNRNYLGDMLHAKSKYDGAERTVDILEQYYNETYGK